MKLTFREISKALSVPLPQSSLGNKIIKGISIDSRTTKKGDLFIALEGRRFDGHSFVKEALKRGAQAALVSKRIPALKEEISVIKVKDTLKALGDIASYYRSKYNVKVVGVTGSNGKTTTKEMICYLLSHKFRVIASFASFNNFVGVPLTIFKIKEDTQILIQEMETNIIGGIKRLSKIVKPIVGVVTNIGPTHLESLRTVYGVFREKAELLKSLPSEGISVINKDDEYFFKLKKSSATKCIITFGVKKKADFRAKNIEFKRNHFYFDVEGVRFVLPTVFYKNIYNAIAAIGVSVGIFGLSLKKSAELFKNFKFLPLRSEVIRIKDIYIINDCFNANPVSVKEALISFGVIKSKNKIAILGDMSELGKDSVRFHYEIGRFVSRFNFKALVCVGNNAYYIGRGAEEGGAGFKIAYCKTIDEAVKFLISVLRRRSFLLIKGSRAMGLERLAEKFSLLFKE